MSLQRHFFIVLYKYRGECEMTLNERIKAIRKHIKKTQKEFGVACGKTRSAIAAYEGGSVIPDDAFIKLLSLKFNVNEEWLRTDKGEMFLDENANIVHELAQKYELTKSQEHFISTFLKLQDNEREIVVKGFSYMANDKDDGNVEPTPTEIDNESN